MVGMVCLVQTWDLGKWKSLYITYDDVDLYPEKHDAGMHCSRTLMTESCSELYRVTDEVTWHGRAQHGRNGALLGLGQVEVEALAQGLEGCFS